MTDINAPVGDDPGPVYVTADELADALRGKHAFHIGPQAVGERFGYLNYPEVLAETALRAITGKRQDVEAADDETAPAPGVTVSQLAVALESFHLNVRNNRGWYGGEVADPDEVARVLHATLGRMAALRETGVTHAADCTGEGPIGEECGGECVLATAGGKGEPFLDAAGTRVTASELAEALLFHDACDPLDGSAPVLAARLLARVRQARTASRAGCDCAPEEPIRPTTSAVTEDNGEPDSWNAAGQAPVKLMDGLDALRACESLRSRVTSRAWGLILDRLNDHESTY